MDIKLTTTLPKVKISPEISRSRNSLFEIVLMIIVAAVFYWFIAMPKAAEISDKQAQLDKVEITASSTQSDLNTLKALSQQLGQDKIKIAHLDEALPLDERAVRLEMLVQSLAQSTGVVVGDVSIDSTGDSAGDPALLADPYAPTRTLQSVTFNLAVSGTMDQLETLLQKLENYGRIMDISSLSLSLNKDSVLDMKMSLAAYYFGTPVQDQSQGGAMKPIH